MAICPTCREDVRKCWSACGDVAFEGAAIRIDDPPERTHDTRAGERMLDFGTLGPIGALFVRVAGSFISSGEAVGTLTVPRNSWRLLRVSPDADSRALSSLSRLPPNGLQIVNFRSTPFGREATASVGALTGLRRLVLWDTPVTDAAIFGLHRLHELEMLDLCQTGVGDPGVEALADLANLRWLSLTATRITDTGVASLSHLPELRRLSLAGTAVTEAGLVALTWLDDLRWLSLGDTAVTDAAVPILAACTALTHLGVAGSKITRAGRQHFTALRPDVELINHRSLPRRTRSI